MNQIATISPIVAFRAANFLVERFAQKLQSENLQILSGEMEPAAGHPSGDPALGHAWKALWGQDPTRTAEDAATVASKFIAQEGDWGHDMGHLQLSEELQHSAAQTHNEVWQLWLHLLDRARNLADPEAWTM